MTKRTDQPRHFRRGRPSYDRIAVYIEFESIRRVTGLSISRLSRHLRLILVQNAAASPRHQPYIEGEGLRQMIGKVRANLYGSVRDARAMGLQRFAEVIAAQVDDTIDRLVEQHISAWEPERVFKLQEIAVKWRQ